MHTKVSIMVNSVNHPEIQTYFSFQVDTLHYLENTSFDILDIKGV